jgi:hypothetical protein
MGLFDLFNRTKEPAAAPETPVFVRNEESWRLSRFNVVGGFVGPAQAVVVNGVENYTAERMAADGYEGLYRTGPSKKFALVPKG